MPAGGRAEEVCAGGLLGCALREGALRGGTLRPEIYQSIGGCKRADLGAVEGLDTSWYGLRSAF